MSKDQIIAWLGERFDLKRIQELVDQQVKKPLPKNISWLHTLGSMSLFLFISQILTGILLLIYYRPTVNEAFESVKFIMTKPSLGWLYRQVHAWGANLMILIVFLHMLRTFFMGAFKKPREITWVIGALLFIFTLVFGFTGYLLPWNQLAYWATTVGTEIAGGIPVIGEWTKIFLRGGAAIGGETLSRFFVIHVIILPWLVFFLIGAHLLLVRVQGISTMEKVDQEIKLKEGEGTPFFPHHVLKEGIVLYLLIGILIGLSILLPFELGEKADPLQTPHAIKPEWYFLPMYQMLKYLPKLLGILMLAMGPLILIGWPFLDKTKARHPRQRPISTGIGIAMIVLLIVFGLLGHWAD
ncbi:MAG: hypothetical protein A2X86_17600 [Bdellovibrionales bacterium GWA2_49_15]|nr:MAG: hypothetical protein A2X86_17600 [Bdellovibrionales bacterium GWA2_49_15]HAZ14197.1 cytochrome bc complex cytochrome b subunit [Bdellovibrionales bacterium]